MELKVNDTLLEEGLVKIEKDRNWSPRVISRLENSIRTANDEDLFRINPLQWALEKNMDAYEAIDLFLYAAKDRLFIMEWNVICPCCGLITQNLRNLHSLHSKTTCSVCFRDDRVSLDDYVQISFTLSPDIRSLRYHHPETLPLDDYCFNYLFERGARIGEPVNSSIKEFVATITAHLSTFSPGEKITLDLDAERGLVACIDMFSQRGFSFVLDGTPAEEVQVVPIRLTKAGFEVPLEQIIPGELRIEHKFKTGVFYRLRPGKLHLKFEQAADSKAALLVWRGGMEKLAKIPDVEFGPSLTAKMLFACQTFHDLFRAEVFQESEGFGVKDVTFLFTDLKGSTQLYQRIGDLNAFAMVREHYGVLNKAILDRHGAVVKTIGDAIMATFNRPVDAVGAGLQMLEELRSLNKTSHPMDLILKIGIHRGAAISVTLNERIDYFGQTVNIASRVQGSAGGEEIFMTDEVYRSQDVQELLLEYGRQAQPVSVDLRGIEDKINIFKVTSAA